MSFFSIAATIKRLHNDLIQGMQQHPQVTSMDTNTAIETRIDSIKAFHFPKALSNHWSLYLWNLENPYLLPVARGPM